MRNKTFGIGAALALSASQIFSGASAANEVVNVYNWVDYIDPAALTEFEAKTGIKVNYDVYDSNEILEAKLMSGGTGYDVVVPTGPFLERQVKANIYAKMDRAQLTNFGNLDATLMKQVARHDPDNAHSAPWAWGTIGIGYNVDMVKERLGDVPVDSLDLLFKPEIAAKLADCGINLLDSPSDVVGIALNYLGLDPNSENKADLAKATDLLKAVRPHVRTFNSGKYISDLANGEICVALGFNGDVLQSQSRAEEAGQGIKVNYVVPKEGTQVWFDLMAIPADAPNKEAAHKFVNFILEGKTAASIANYVYYAVPNTAAEPFLNDDVKTNPGIYPTDEVKAKLFTANAHSAKFDRLLTRAWTNIKSGR